MKKLILITTLTLSTAASAYAGQSNGINGLVIGAGGGAVMGQAIGRNTESTIIGTAIGSMVGYIIGSEIDTNYRHHPQGVHYGNRPAVRQPVVRHEKHVTYNYYSKPYHKSPPAKRHCKEAEILGTVNGKAKKIYGTVCKTDQGWELVSEKKYRNRPEKSRSHWKNNRHYHDNRHEQWVHRRF